MLNGEIYRFATKNLVHFHLIFRKMTGKVNEKTQLALAPSTSTLIRKRKRQNDLINPDQPTAKKPVLTPANLAELNVDCLELIFMNLKLIDLFNVSGN